MPRDTNGAGLPKLAEIETPTPGGIAEFTPMPAGRGTEPLSGLRRGVLINLSVPCAQNNYQPPVKSISLRRPGYTKGKRLIVLQGHFGKQMGLLTYLRSKAEEATADQKSASTHRRTKKAVG